LDLRIADGESAEWKFENPSCVRTNSFIFNDAIEPASFLASNSLGFDPYKEDKRPATGKAFAWRVNQNLIKPDFSPGTPHRQN